MKIEQIKNYNQKLLAVLGSIVVLMASIGLIMLIFFGVTEMVRTLRYNNEEGGILSDKKIEELQKENKRKQLISFDFPRLVDTINSIYVIPIKHKTLNTAEYIDDGVLGIMDSYGKVKSDSRYSSHYYGSFNNLIVYDLNTGSVHKLFDARVNFGEIRTKSFENSVMILFTVANQDTYKDGVVNLSDLKALYIYSTKEDKLRMISSEGMDIMQYDFLLNSKDLLIQFGVDYNRNGKHEEDVEPSLIKKYDFEDDKLVNIIPDELEDELQKLLEGTKSKLIINH